MARMNARNKYEPCSQDWAAAYLNRPDVQKAIHVKGNVTWHMCSNHILHSWNMTEKYQSMVPIYHELIANSSLRIMIYSGDDDSVCSTQSSQRWIWSTGYNNTEKWHPYMLDGQVAGYTTNFTSSAGGGFRFTTVHGAGHMVPATQPRRAAYVLRKFLA